MLILSLLVILSQVKTTEQRQEKQVERTKKTLLSFEKSLARHCNHDGSHESQGFSFQDMVKVNEMKMNLGSDQRKKKKCRCDLTQPARSPTPIDRQSKAPQPPGFEVQRPVRCAIRSLRYKPPTTVLHYALYKFTFARQRARRRCK